MVEHAFPTIPFAEVLGKYPNQFANPLQIQTFIVEIKNRWHRELPVDSRDAFNEDFRAVTIAVSAAFRAALLVEAFGPDNGIGYLLNAYRSAHMNGVVLTPTQQAKVDDPMHHIVDEPHEDQISDPAFVLICSEPDLFLNMLIGITRALFNNYRDRNPIERYRLVQELMIKYFKNDGFNTSDEEESHGP